MKTPIKTYINVIDDFLSKRITVDQFETKYNKIFQTDPGGQTKEVFLILNDLFAEVDDYWVECKPEDETGDVTDPISEQTLRRYAAIALEKLKLIEGA